VHDVQIINLFLHQLTVDCEGNLTAGSGDLEFIPGSTYPVTSQNWQRTGLVVPPATQNLFTTTPVRYPLRSAHFQRIRSGMERVQVDVNATSPGFSGQVSVQAWFNVDCA